MPFQEPSFLSVGSLRISALTARAVRRVTKESVRFHSKTEQGRSEQNQS